MSTRKREQMIDFQENISKFEKEVCSICEKSKCKRGIIIEKHKRETIINCLEYERRDEDASESN